MPRYLGLRRIAYCQRGGHKIPYTEIVEDGEIPGLLVDKRWADDVHPQRFLPPVPGDQIAIDRPSAPSENQNATIKIGTLWDPETGQFLFNPAVTVSIGAYEVEPKPGYATVDATPQAPVLMALGAYEVDASVTPQTLSVALTIGDFVTSSVPIDGYSDGGYSEDGYSQ